MLYRVHWIEDGNYYALGPFPLHQAEIEARTLEGRGVRDITVARDVEERVMSQFWSPDLDY
jgi:hypothetical protein